MQLRKSRSPVRSKLNVAPMIDVVFLLIIFFMTVSQATQVNVESLDLPQATQGESNQQLASQFIINLRSDGSLYVDQTLITLDTLRNRLHDEAQHRTPAGLSVLIRSDKSSAWHVVSPIMRICTDIGIHRVKVAVVQ